MWSEWKSNFLQITDKHAPTCTRRFRKKNYPWITVELKKHTHNRDVTKIKAIKSNNPHDWANYKRMRNQVNTEIKSAKRLFYTNKFVETKGDPRKTWQAINELTCRKTDKPSIKEANPFTPGLFEGGSAWTGGGGGTESATAYNSKTINDNEMKFVRVVKDH